MTLQRIPFSKLSDWHQGILRKLLSENFPGHKEISMQLLHATFSVIDENKSLQIFSSMPAAPVQKTIPVEACAPDYDSVPIQVLLFTRNGVAYMLEILRADGEKIIRLPPYEAFSAMVLAP